MTSYTVQEIAERYRISDHTVLAWIRHGELLATNVAPVQGRRPQWRVHADDLDDFEARRRTYPERLPPRRKKPRPIAKTGDRY